MKISHWRWLAVLGVIATCAMMISLPAQEPDKKTVPNPQAEVPPVPRGDDTPAIPANLQDPGFDRVFDAHALGEAWAQLDAPGLADAALQLAEGERILLRSHRAISADKMFRLAAQVAADKKDKKTLDRLALAAEKGPAEWKAVIAAARLSAEGTRSIEVPLALRVDRATPAEFAACHQYIQDLNAVQVRQDRVTLEEIAQIIDGDEDVSAESRVALRKMIVKLRDTLPKEDAVAKDSTQDVLNQLSAGSRGGLSSLDPFNRNSIWHPPAPPKPPVLSRWARWRITNNSDNLLHVRVYRKESNGQDGSKTFHNQIEKGKSMTFSGTGTPAGTLPYVAISYYDYTSAEPRKIITVYDNRAYVVTGSRGGLRWRDYGQLP